VTPSRGESMAIPNDFICRLSLTQFHEMLREGIVTQDDPVEFLNGWLIAKVPKNPSHRVATRQIRRALESRVPAGWYVDSQEPITLADSEPEPDGMIVRGDSAQYLDRHPGAADIALVIEVSDKTLKRDRGAKKLVYAAAGIPFYWILNLNDRGLEVYSDPSGSGEQADYRLCEQLGADDTLALIVDGREIAAIPVADLLP